ncbi:MAG: FapA family protein, partial [Fibrobacter sp.]|nr:FapA family protein [Fibrobacter sp.]
MANAENNSEQNTGNAVDEKLLESFLEKAEKEISLIEMQEFVNGISSEELEEKGFLGRDAIKITRPAQLKEETENGIKFEDDVEYAEKKGNDISDIKLDSVKYLPDVLPDAIIAKAAFSAGQEQVASKVFALVNADSYKENSNIEVKIQNKEITFVAKINGKVVLFNGIPYIIPSDEDGYCTVKISCDNMRVTVDMFPSAGNGKPLTYDIIMENLDKLGVKAGILKSDISDCIEKVQTTGAELSELLVAEGKHAVDGEDATIEYFFQKEKIEDDFSILPDGRVDYRKKASIPVVKQNDMLLRINKPGAGVDGFDVFGKVIKANDGQVPVILAGENVRVSKDGNEFFTECDGQVSFNGKVLNVFKHYYVDGDVDYGTGNIDFNGNVTIKGSVLEGFEVNATGDVTIMKSIDAGKVNAGRDLKVFGGILGRGDKIIISCGRDITASHFQNAYIEAQRDIYIGNSCVQSVVYCNGKMYLQKLKGSIIGGTVNAMGGIDAKSIGTDVGTKTEIIVGNDFLVQKTATEIRNTLKIYNDNLNKIDAVLTPIMKYINQKVPISSGKKSRLMMVLDRRKQINKNKEIMEWKLKDIEERVHADITSSVKVSGK